MYLMNELDTRLAWARELSRKILEDGCAPNTRRAHASDLKYFWIWAETALGMTEHYPVSPDVVVAYLVDHVLGMPYHVAQVLKRSKVMRVEQQKFATISRRLGSLAAKHDVLGLVSPTKAPEVRDLITRSKRILKQERPPQPAKPITKNILDMMLVTCEDSLIGGRDRALLLFAFGSGGRRRSEIVNLKAEDLLLTRDGFLATLWDLKNDREKKGADVPVFGKAYQAMAEWLKRSEISEGYVFRALTAKGELSDRPISEQWINQIVKERVSMTGRDPSLYSAHSLRHGAITEMRRQGVPLRDIMQLALKRSVEDTVNYGAPSPLNKNKGSRIADDDR